MRVLMVSANTEQINMPVLPLGMACVSAAVESAGHDIRVVNLMEKQHVSRLLAPAIDEFAPEVIGISVRNIDDQNLDDYPMPKPGVHLSVPPVENSRKIMVPFQTRRGCAMNCSYCSTPAIEGRHLRSRLPEKAVENLQLFAQSGFKNFFFVDNTFNLPDSYAPDASLLEPVFYLESGLDGWLQDTLRVAAARNPGWKV